MTIQWNRINNHIHKCLYLSQKLWHILWGWCQKPDCHVAPGPELEVLGSSAELWWLWRPKLGIWGFLPARHWCGYRAAKKMGRWAVETWWNTNEVFGIVGYGRWAVFERSLMTFDLPWAWPKFWKSWLFLSRFFPLFFVVWRIGTHLPSVEQLGCLHFWPQGCPFSHLRASPCSPWMEAYPSPACQA